MAIRGMHALFYSGQSDSVRDFFRDKVKLPYTDTGGGWLIFDVAEGDFGVHPTETDEDQNTHNVSFYCDDIEGTVAGLRENGVEFLGEVADRGWGKVIEFRAPGGLQLMLYEPKYQKRAAAKPAGAVKRVVKKVAAKAKRPAKKPAPQAAAKKSSKKARRK